MIAVEPAPGGSLRIDVECTSAPRDLVGALHQVTINADWTVEVPHDGDADRVARAFGGWSSCLLFVESVVPAYRHVLEVMHHPASLRRDRSGRWLNGGGPGCPHPTHRHPRLRDAVRHELTPDHATTAFRSVHWRVPDVDLAAWNQFHDLMWQAREHWAGDAGEDAVQLGRHAAMWNAGVLPGRAGAILAGFDRVVRPVSPVALVDAYFAAIEARA
jgi:hypothetical protein